MSYSPTPGIMFFYLIIESNTKVSREMLGKCEENRLVFLEPDGSVFLMSFTFEFSFRIMASILGE